MVTAANPYRDQRTQYDPGMGMDELCDALNLGLYIGVTSPSGAAPTISSAIISFLQSGSGARATELQTRGRNVVYVTDFYANGSSGVAVDKTGSVDSTAGIQAAIDSVGADGEVWFPQGTYKVTSTISVANDRVHLRGAGMSATQINFAPTANDTLFAIGKSAAAVLFQGSLRDMTLYGTDTTYTKIAIDLLDTSGFQVENVFIHGAHVSGGASYWGNATGDGSVGLKTRGREFGLIRNLYNYAMRPILIAGNPNSTLDIDHFHFQNTYLAALSNPVVSIESGVNLSNVTFDGAQPWVGGTDGLYWVDTTTTQKSYQLSLENIRWEQGSNANSYMVRIEHNNGLQDLTIRSCVGEDRKGFYFRNIQGVVLEKLRYGLASEAANWATTTQIAIRQCFWQTSSTATLADVRLAWALPRFPNSGGLPNEAFYDADTNTSLNIEIDKSVLVGKSITVADTASAEITINTFQGYIFVTNSVATQAIFTLQGANNSTAEIADNTGQYSITAATGTSTNIYWSAANSRYEIENRTGQSQTYRILFVGFKG